MRCHYEVLGIERDATPKDIKKAFHLQALKWHPDKHQRNNISPEDATIKFQEIQSSYEVLSDPHERKWYDDHREQILRGDEDNDGATEDDLNLFKYFSPSVYKGFGDDENGFYAVFRELFEKIDGLDMASAGTSTATAAPSFGTKKTSIDDVLDFYGYWMSYVTQRSFSWVDEYKTTDAPTRQIRRAMEKENKKLRDAAKKAFTADVRELVEYVRKRDQRMIAHLKQKEQEKKEQQLEEEERRKARQAAFEAEREAFQEQERQRWEAEHAHSRFAAEAIEEEMEKLRQKMDAEVLLCDLCNKSFKSTKQLKNNINSKKHKDREIELGISVSTDFDSLEDALDMDIQAELIAAGRLKPNESVGKPSETMSTTGLDKAEEESTQEDDATARAQLEEAEAKAKAAEQLRLEKEQKAADKRKERKEKRKEKKQMEVEKIVSAAKSKAEKQEEVKEKKGGRKGKKNK
ncbi:TPA: hypothetical protein N0F65_003875 [Lagenidium giganteum]|uniref:J domain-containing protein n=1 Tax=Lagenidium giganteum TaxID=4803 RepID=A0AAV2ZF91_9STRA|nr:TPA: hypothetical protein N0F65_003875 [Lagenidium giganteum]